MSARLLGAHISAIFLATKRKDGRIKRVGACKRRQPVRRSSSGPPRKGYSHWRTGTQKCGVTRGREGCPIQKAAGFTTSHTYGIRQGQNAAAGLRLLADVGVREMHVLCDSVEGHRMRINQRSTRHAQALVLPFSRQQSVLANIHTRAQHTRRNPRNACSE